MKYQTVTSEDMENVGKKIGSHLKGGDIVLLYVELGSGKSTLTKGIAKELGVKELATSPTFTLMNVYKAEHPEIKQFIHADTYRLTDEEDLKDVGVDDYLGKKDTLCIIEWPDRIEETLKDRKTIKVSIQYIDRERRKINVE